MHGSRFFTGFARPPLVLGGFWAGVTNALKKGRRGLPGRDSLSALLARHGRKPPHAQPKRPGKPWSEARRLARPARPRPPRRPPPLRLSEADIMRYADDHHARTGRWPQAHSGAVPGAPGENWRKIDNALSLGLRGLRGGDTLARLLRRSGRAQPPADESQPATTTTPDNSHLQ